MTGTVFYAEPWMYGGFSVRRKNLLYTKVPGNSTLLSLQAAKFIWTSWPLSLDKDTISWKDVRRITFFYHRGADDRHFGLF